MCDLIQLIRPNTCSHLTQSGRNKCKIPSQVVLFAEVQQLQFLSTDSHSDFQAEAVAGTPENVMDAIKQDVAKNKVMLYMKVWGTMLSAYTAAMCHFRTQLV